MYIALSLYCHVILFTIFQNLQKFWHSVNWTMAADCFHAFQINVTPIRRFFFPPILGAKEEDYFLICVRKTASPATDERKITNYGIVTRPIYFWVNLQSHICGGNHIILTHLCSLILSPQNPLGG